MNYRFLSLLNIESLNRFVFAIYELKTGDKDCIYYAVPNGLIGLSIILEGSATISKNEAWYDVPQANIFGLVKKPQKIKASVGYREIAIGFSPYFLKLFHHISMSEFTDGKITDAYEVFNKNNLEQLVEKLFLAQTDAQILSAVDTFLISQLIKEKVDLRLISAIKLITFHKISKVDCLSDKLNLSTSTLRNIFRDNIGLSPKEYIRIKRINDILSFKIESDEKLTQLAYCFGYFDQAHFIHDFKTTVGVSPKKYFQNKKLVLDFYNYGRWIANNFVNNDLKESII